jgi:hypothetical protein
MARTIFSLIIFFGLVTSFLLSPQVSLASATTGKCLTPGPNSTDTSDKNNVGIFMVGVCSECWDEGDCSLGDIMTVVANIGNYILSIVGGLVLLAYILGGFWWIISHGNKAYVDKGKSYIKNATVGLIIVLFAYVGVYTLDTAVRGGFGPDSDTNKTSSGVICDGSDESIGKECGDGMICTEYGGCYTKCYVSFPEDRMCYDPNSGTGGALGINTLDCLEGYCSGTMECCAIEKSIGSD